MYNQGVLRTSDSVQADEDSEEYGNIAKCYPRDKSPGLAIVTYLPSATKTEPVFGACGEQKTGNFPATGCWAVPFKAKKLLALAIFVEWKLPFIHNDLQALIEIAILAGLIVANVFIYYFLARS